MRSQIHGGSIWIILKFSCTNTQSVHERATLLYKLIPLFGSWIGIHVSARFGMQRVSLWCYLHKDTATQLGWHNSALHVCNEQTYGYTFVQVSFSYRLQVRQTWTRLLYAWGCLQTMRCFWCLCSVVRSHLLIETGSEWYAQTFVHVADKSSPVVNFTSMFWNLYLSSSPNPMLMHITRLQRGTASCWKAVPSMLSMKYRGL